MVAVAEVTGKVVELDLTPLLDRVKELTGSRSAFIVKAVPTSKGVYAVLGSYDQALQRDVYFLGLAPLDGSGVQVKKISMQTGEWWTLEDIEDGLVTFSPTSPQPTVRRLAFYRLYSGAYVGPALASAVPLYPTFHALEKVQPAVLVFSKCRESGLPPAYGPLKSYPACRITAYRLVNGALKQYEYKEEVLYPDPYFLPHPVGNYSWYTDTYLFEVLTSESQSKSTIRWIRLGDKGFEVLGTIEREISVARPQAGTATADGKVVLLVPEKEDGSDRFFVEVYEGGFGNLRLSERREVSIPEIGIWSSYAVLDVASTSADCADAFHGADGRVSSTAQVLAQMGRRKVCGLRAQRNQQSTRAVLWACDPR